MIAPLATFRSLSAVRALEARDSAGPMPPMPVALRAETEIAAKVEHGVRTGEQLADQWLDDHHAASAQDFARALPGLLKPPPDAAGTAAELAFMRDMVPTRTPVANDVATWQARFGTQDLWDSELAAWSKTVSRDQAQQGADLLRRADDLDAQAIDVAKDGFDRKRPYEVDPSFPPIWPGNGRRSPSYPSGHASAAFAAATIMAHLNPDKAGVYAAMARNMAWSRVYGGVHFPSDVAAGALAGTAIATAVIRQADKH
jgi:hypothetical protein